MPSRNTSNAQPVYKIEKSAVALLPMLPKISGLADLEKEALGFLPEVAYKDAIANNRLSAMLAIGPEGTDIAGYILHSGVYPHARVQQVIVGPLYRRAKIGSALIRDLVSSLEKTGYLTLSSAVASDLYYAQKFYEQHGFIAKYSRAGGAARNRQIIIRSKDLETASFFSLLEPQNPTSQDAIDLGLRQRSASLEPLYGIDLNVLFDLTKGPVARNRAPLAEKLFGAALGHRVRLVVAPEFISELERTTFLQKSDPILALARQLPRLPTFAESEIQPIADRAHELVFVRSNSKDAGSKQALSDARHIAQAALARASGYITSDTAILAAREELLKEIGIDVTALDEFLSFIPENGTTEVASMRGDGFEIKHLSTTEFQSFLQIHQFSSDLIKEFSAETAKLQTCAIRAIYEAGNIVGVSACIAPNKINESARLLVYVDSGNLGSEIFADYLLDAAIRDSCTNTLTTIELRDLPGQAQVRRAALLRGCFGERRSATLTKIAVGRPITTTNWPAIAAQAQHRTQLRLPTTMPDLSSVKSGLTVTTSDGRELNIRFIALEDVLGPTIIAWPGRPAVIVPIAKTYADELLGTGTQFPLFGSPKASFVTRRTYFNSPRTASILRSGIRILFYESQRSGGRGCVVAVARIVDTALIPKSQIPTDLLGRAVVEDMDSISVGPDVLATSFDNLLCFPSPVSFDLLRKYNAVGASNLQTATPLACESLERILDAGWSNV